MKFVKKFLILGLFTLLGVGFCNAGLVASGEVMTSNISSNYQAFDFGSGVCMYGSNNTTITYSLDGVNNSGNLTRYKMYCFTGIVYLKSTTTQQARTVSLDLIKETCPTCPTIDSNYCTSNNLCPSCPSCPSQYTSLECQTEYSLIPVSDVTENYCTANFDLISPADCPISSGTGDTQRSALFLNNVQYAGASNIYVNISDLLDYSTTYIDSGSSFVLDVDGYVADTGYLNDILTVQEYHPNSEDFTTAFVSVLTLGLPYVVVALFVLLVRKLVKKIFKS